MAVENPVKVTRYGRHERTTHSDPAAAEVTAGDVITLSNGEVSPAGADFSQSDRLLIAIDDRERGMEIGDTYAIGESVLYVDASGGAFNVLLAQGNTIDPATDERLVVDGDGKVAPYDGAGGDVEEDVIFQYDGDGAVSSPADDFLAVPTVVN